MTRRKGDSELFRRLFPWGSDEFIDSWSLKGRLFEAALPTGLKPEVFAKPVALMFAAPAPFVIVWAEANGLCNLFGLLMAPR